MVLADVAKIVLLYLLLRFVLRRLVDRVLWPAVKEGEKKVDPAQASRIKTLASLVNSSVSYILTFVFGIMLLRALRLDPIPLLTTASVAGLAVGFGAQKLVKDMISGFFILLENQYGVGDYVTVGAVTGTVEEVGLRTTRIRDDAGKLYILSNGDITQVCNQSRGAVASFVEIGVAAVADVGKATEIINKAGEELAHDQSDLGFAEPPRVQGLGAMDAAKLTLRVSCPVTAPAKLTQAQIALRGLAHQRLVEAEIGLA
jgi:small conductance mechanosensitive channel